MITIKKGFKPCSINEFNNHLAKVEQLKKKVNNFEPDDSNYIKDQAYLYTKLSKCYLIFSYMKWDKGKLTRDIGLFYTDLNDNYPDGTEKYILPACNNIQACSKVFKFPRIHEKEDAPINASGIIWSNPKYYNKPVEAIEYDMHLAWASFLYKSPLPDTTVKPHKGFVKEGEIGFIDGGEDSISIGYKVVFSGYADYIFPIIYNPRKDYLEKLNKEVNESEGLIRQNLKNKINHYLGGCQNFNCFIRVAVISQCNQYIESLIEKYEDKLIYSVSDSLAATEHIPELDALVGNDLGSWNIKKQGTIYKFKDGGRVWLQDNKVVSASWRGVPEGYILGLTVDEIKNDILLRDSSKNCYKLNLERLQVELNG